MLVTVFISSECRAFLAELILECDWQSWRGGYNLSIFYPQVNNSPYLKTSTYYTLSYLG